MKCNAKGCKNEAEPDRKFCTKCREYKRTYYKKYRAEKKGDGKCTYTDCPNPPDPGYRSCARCRGTTKKREDTIRPLLRAKGNKYYQKVKSEVFLAYGGFICACCGVEHKEFLSIDHINGDGPAHRKEMTGSARNGRNLYYWLKNNNFPPGFRVLCMNCNFSLGHHGYCPHRADIQKPLTLGPRKALPTAVEAA